jgi:hypothetical protein
MDSSNGFAQGTDTQPVSSPGATPSVDDSQKGSSAPQHEERTFRQSEVNDIVKKAKYGAVEDFRRLQNEQPQYAREKFGDASMQPSSQPNEEHYRKIAAEEAQRLRDQWINESRTKAENDNAQRIVQNFWNKVAPGKEKYQDFEKVVGDIEYARFPNTVQLLSEYVDNSADMLYELGKDRFKMAQLEQLALLSPKDAIIQAQRLSQSLKDNDTASKTRTPSEPLSQLRPSNTGTDNGVMGVRDYRNKWKV